MNKLIHILVAIAGKMNSHAELEDILQTIIDSAKEFLRVARVSVFLPEKDILRMCAWAGFIPDKAVTHKIGDGITGEVALTGQSRVVNSGGASAGEYKATSFMSLPLTAGGKVVGVLNLTDKEGDFFSEEDISIALFLASQCALAVERHKLFLDMRGAERIKAIGVLRASVAHDIRNLLGIVEVYLSLMEGGDISSLFEYIAAIRQEITRVQGLTEDIMLYTKEHIDLKYTRFSVNELLDSIAKQYNLSLKDMKISVETKVKGAVVITADKDRLFRVIFNLVHNAVQALEEEEGKVTLLAKETGGKVSICIADNGKGIPKNIVKSIFDPFVTSGKAYGTGLGLAIVNEIVETHKGKISVRSSEGKYTLFRIVLPVGS